MWGNWAEVSAKRISFVGFTVCVSTCSAHFVCTCLRTRFALFLHGSILCFHMFLPHVSANCRIYAFSSRSPCAVQSDSSRVPRFFLTHCPYLVIVHALQSSHKATTRCHACSALCTLLANVFCTSPACHMLFVFHIR